MKNTFALSAPIAGFVLAIFVSSFFKFDLAFCVFLIFLSIVLFIFQKFLVFDGEEKKKIFFISFFALFFAFGILRYRIADSNPLDPALENAVGKEVTLKAVIIDEPQQKESGNTLAVHLQDLIANGSSTSVSAEALVSTGLYPQFQYGDMVSISGKLAKPANFSIAPIDASSSTSTKDFDYVSYLAKDDIFYTMSFAQVSLISSGHGDPIKAFLLRVKDAFTENIGRLIPEPEASLFSGIELGAKSSMDKETTDDFRIAGLSHIVALSGYNITVVAGAIASLLSFLPKMIGLSGGIIGIILFVIMSGSTSTAVRAGIMALIAILAKITGRDYQAGRALVAALLLMVIVNPKILVFDISFQLSFLATVAIIYVAPILKGKFRFVTEKYGLRDIVATTIAAQILVLPLIVWKMGQLSVYALPANMLVLGFVPATMFFGFIAGMLGFIWAPLAFPFAWVTYGLLLYMISVARFFASLPFSSFFIPWFSPLLMSAAYGCIFVWILHERKRSVSAKITS